MRRMNLYLMKINSPTSYNNEDKACILSYYGTQSQDDAYWNYLYRIALEQLSLCNDSTVTQIVHT